MHLHNGFLDSLKQNTKYDGATSILVSQFILNQTSRLNFFKEINNFLKNDGILINADLSCNPTNYDSLLNLWVKLFDDNHNATPEQINKSKEAYSSSVGVLPPNEVENIIKNANFNDVNLFFQSLLLHAWVCKVN